MLRLFPVGLLLALALIATSAQLTGPETADLWYHLRAGEHLHYKLTDFERHDSTDPVHAAENFDRISDIRIDVIHVDSLGNADLRIANDEHFSWTNGQVPPNNGDRSKAHSAYQVRIDARGHVLSGVILNRTPNDIALQRAGVADSTLLRDEFELLFRLRPHAHRQAIGTKWIDSTRRSSSSGSLIELQQDRDEIEKESADIALTAHSYVQQLNEGKQAFESSGLVRSLIRQSDGALLHYSDSSTGVHEFGSRYLSRISIDLLDER